MKVFISYGALPDQVTALRLQAPGAAHGLTVYVPPAWTRQGFAPVNDADSQMKPADADVVLGVVGTGLTETCRQELNAGLTLKKNMIVMASPHLAPGLGPTFGANLVPIDPLDTGAAASDRRASSGDAHAAEFEEGAAGPRSAYGPGSCSSVLSTAIDAPARLCDRQFVCHRSRPSGALSTTHLPLFRGADPQGGKERLVQTAGFEGPGSKVFRFLRFHSALRPL